MVAKVQNGNSPTGRNSILPKIIPDQQDKTRAKRTNAGAASKNKPILSLLNDTDLLLHPNYYSDMGNSARMHIRHGDTVRFVPDWGKWLIWDGKRWSVDKNYAVLELAKDSVLALFDDVRKVREEHRADYIKFARESQKEARLLAMIDLLKSERGISIAPDALDSDDMLFNVENGTLDLRTMQIRAHSRDDLMTKLAPVTFDPKAVAPIWLDFLNKIMRGDGDLIQFLQESIGVSLSGDISDEIFIVMHGAKGSNGKSTFLETVKALLGDYAHTASHKTFIRQRESGVDNDLAALQGARFCAASETEEGQHLADVRIKELTGGDTMTARYLYHEEFSFKPKATLFLATNHRPRVRNGDDALWRRMRLIPFYHRFGVDGEPKVDKRMVLERHKSELSGILNWALAGWAARQSRGAICFPDTMRRATAEYRASNDVIGLFLDECCVVNPRAQVGAGAIYEAYKTWCDANGEKNKDNASLKLYLVEQCGHEYRRTKAARFYAGVGLRADYPEFIETEEPTESTPAPAMQTHAAPKAKTGALISPPIPEMPATLPQPTRAKRLELTDREKTLLSHLPETTRDLGLAIDAVMNYCELGEPPQTLTIPHSLKGLTKARQTYARTKIDADNLFRLLGYLIDPQGRESLSEDDQSKRVEFAYSYLERLKAMKGEPE